MLKDVLCVPAIYDDPLPGAGRLGRLSALAAGAFS